MDEIWKDIPEHEGFYQVSNLGRVKSIDRLVWTGRGWRKTEGRILKPSCCGDGYLCVHLAKNGNVRTLSVHRLVAKSFCLGYDEATRRTVVNHKDEDRTNNKASNLEWVTIKENVNYGTHNERVRQTKRGKPNLSCSIKIGMFTLENELIRVFVSLSEAARRMGVSAGGICLCAKGRISHFKGYKWKYV